MSRLASAAKAHYYPLPLNLIPLINSYISAPHGGRLYDPCAGEGVALSLLAQTLGLEPFGCELDRHRAAAALAAANEVLVRRNSLPPQRACPPVFTKGKLREGVGSGSRLQHTDRQQTRVFHSDSRLMKISPAAFNCLYLNPPFDHIASGDGDNRKSSRLEYQFLRDNRPTLMPDGLLIYVVPQRMLVHRKTADYLAAWFSDLRLFRFPDDSYPTYKQIVLFGRRHRRAAVPDPNQVKLLMEAGRLGAELPFIETAAQPVYSLPRLTVSLTQLTFLPAHVDMRLVYQEATTQGVTAGEAWQNHLFPQRHNRKFRPLTPLRQGHLVNIISAGYLNNQILQEGDEVLLIKGHTYKGKRSHQTRERTGSGGIKLSTFETEHYVTDITTITPNGRIQSVSGKRLEPFLTRWIGQLTQMVTDEYQPVYQFDLNGYEPVLDKLNQGRIIPTTTMRGLAPAQKHTVAAAAMRLDPRHQNKRDALIIGEMGVGKTLLGPAVAACIRARRILVLCPPHLTEKWAREIKYVVPKVRVMQIQTIADVDAFFRLKATTDSPCFGILKETSARAASGWRHAYEWCGPISQARPNKKRSLWQDIRAASQLIPTSIDQLHEDTTIQIGRGQHTLSGAARFNYIGRFRTPACPHCGERLTVNGRPMTPSDFKGKRFKCHACRTPLSCFTRRHREGEQPTTLKESLRHHRQIEEAIRNCHARSNLNLTGLFNRDAYWGLRRPQPIGYARTPLASYIKKRYKGKLDLLIADEIHHYKAADSDRGYAFHRLACASKKVLGLTGTIYGGKASTLFHLLYRLASEMKQPYAHNDVAKWVARYGVLQEVETVMLDEDGRQTGNSRAKRRIKELPGGSPAMIHWLLDRSVFLALEDMGFALPDYTETPRIVSMTPTMAAHYGSLKTQLLSELKERLVMGDRSLLAAYLQSLLSWPDSPWRGKRVVDPKTGKEVAAIPAVAGLQPGVAPKEAAILHLIQQELAQNRKILLLCQQTDTLDITGEWMGMLKQRQIQAAVLRCQPSKREAWIDKQEAKGTQVIITHPKRIETGLDILGYPTVIWIGQEFSVYTVLQACRRPYRIGQTQPVKIFFFTYAETLQETALTLVASKMAAAVRVDGNTVADDSLAELDQLMTGDMMTVLAKIVTGQQENLGVASLRDAFRKANTELKQSLSYIGDYAIEAEGPALAAPTISTPIMSVSTQPLPIPMVTSVIEETAVSTPPLPKPKKLTLLALLRG